MGIRSRRDMKIPNFIIVGAMKSGTTTLSDMLAKHPEIHIPSAEAHFFNNKFEKGVGFYKWMLTQGAAEGVRLFGEKTPTYSYLAHIPGRIAMICPDAKIIWILRDPVDRTFSNYLHAINAGKEPESFEYALEHEEERLAENVFKGYRRRSIYAEQIRRYLEHFGMDQMFFMSFEDMILPYDEDHVLNELFAFLGISPEGYSFPVSHKNPTTVRNSRMSEATRRELEEFFLPHNEDLFGLIGKWFVWSSEGKG